MTQMESPKRKMQKKNDYQRHKLFRKIKRRRKAQAEAEQQIAEKQLRKKLRLPKFGDGKIRQVYTSDIHFNNDDAAGGVDRYGNKFDYIVLPEKVVTARKIPTFKDIEKQIGRKITQDEIDKVVAADPEIPIQVPQSIEKGMYSPSITNEFINTVAGTTGDAVNYLANKAGLPNLAPNEQLIETRDGDALFDLPVYGQAAPEISRATKQAIEWMQNKVPYRFSIPTNEDTFYRILHGTEAIDDANNSGMITRTFAPDYQFPYFTKGQLYSKQNPSFNFDNSVVITSKPGSGQSFHFVQDGAHVIDPKRVINVGDSATPVEISGIGNAYNSSPVENFEYWTRGNGWLTKHLWKRNQFTPFKNQRVIDTKSFGNSFAEGSESEVFNDPANKFAVVKEFSSGYKNNPFGMRYELVRRNSVPGAMPTKMIGMSNYGYPILQQGKVIPIEEGTPWTYNLAKDAKQLFENAGYKYGLHQGIPNNGNWKIIDVSPQNLGYDSFGNLRTIDVMPDRLFNSGKDIRIKPSKRGTFTKAAKQHGMSVQGFANKVLKNPSKYSTAMRKKANFAHNAASWKH